MIKLIDWDKDRLRFRYSEIYEHWGGGAVTIDYEVDGKWSLALPDMTPNSLRMAQFPKRVYSTAEMTSLDGKTRILNKDGSVEIVRQLITPPPKPKLHIPERPKLIVPED